MKLRLFFTFYSLFAIQLVDAQGELNLYGELEFGAYEVGVKQINFISNSRKEHKEIRITLWYPAKGSKDQLKFSEYLDYNLELNRDQLLKEASIGIGGEEHIFSTDSLRLILNATMKGTRETEAENGKFPLLIWSSRYGTMTYQNIMSEYIASHGYVVAFAEDIPNSPFPWEIQSNIEKRDILNQHVSDINASIEFLSRQNNIDSTKLGLLSWSYAGESAILAQMSNPQIDLVVGLSSLGFSSGVYLGPALEAKVDLSKLNVPYLILTQKFRGNGSVITVPKIFNSMHTNSRFVTFGELAHGNFNALEGMIPGILRTNKVHSWSKGGEMAQIGYEALCEITLSFLNAIFHESRLEPFETRTSQLKDDLPMEFISIKSPENNE